MCLGPYAVRNTRNGWVLSSTEEDEQQLAVNDFLGAYRAMLDAFERWFRSLPSKSVYFIGERVEYGARVKIGTSINPQARLRTLQVGYPERLQILALCSGGPGQERKYHHRFASQRLVGEWFVLDGAMVREIDRLRRAGGS